MIKTVSGEALNYLDSWLEFRYSQEEIPGFAVAISHKGKIIFDKAYGFANVEQKRALETTDIFRIASHSKTFTATSIMQLQEKGKLRIDDKVADYLVWLKSHKDKRWQNVTIRQLLSHGAGVIRDGLHADYWQLERQFPDEAELKEEILASNLIIDNNVKLKYSNFGYSLLGLLIKEVSGLSYSEYVNKNIINPLKLENTGADLNNKIKPRLVTGYSRRDVDKTRLPVVNVDTKSMASATGFYSTAKDLCVYFNAHIVGTNKLLNDESKKEMQRVHYHAKSRTGESNIDYGLGIEIENDKSRRIIGHGGGFPGQITGSKVSPEESLVVVVLTNCNGGPSSEISKAIFSILDYFQNNTKTTKPKNDFSKLTGRYFSLWGTSDIVAIGDKLVSTYPNNWYPFYSPEELKFVKDNTFKIVDTGSFESEGELVIFEFENEKVKRINFSGSSMWPEKDWIKKQKSRKIIGTEY